MAKKTGNIIRILHLLSSKPMTTKEIMSKLYTEKDVKIRTHEKELKPLKEDKRKKLKVKYNRLNKVMSVLKDKNLIQQSNKSSRGNDVVYSLNKLGIIQYISNRFLEYHFKINPFVNEKENINTQTFSEKKFIEQETKHLEQKFIKLFNLFKRYLEWVIKKDISNTNLDLILEAFVLTVGEKNYRMIIKEKFSVTEDYPTDFIMRCSFYYRNKLNNPFIMA